MVRLKTDAASKDDDNNNNVYAVNGEVRKKILNSRVIINYTCVRASAVKYKTEIRLCSRAYATSVLEALVGGTTVARCGAF